MSLKKYELVFLVSSDNVESEALEVAAKIKKGLEKKGAKIGFEDFWGKKDLAYPIKKQNSAYYFLYEMEIDGAEIDQLEKDLVLNKDVLRHLVVLSPDGYQIAKFDDLQEEVKEEPKKKSSAPKKVAPKKTFVKKEVIKEEPKPKAKLTTDNEEKELDKGQLDEKLNKLLSDDLDI